MDFFTHCCKKLFDPVLRLGRLGLCVFGLVLAMHQPAMAGVRIETINVTSTDQTVQLSTQLGFELPAQVDEALHRGVPLFFNAEAILYQDRWYWMDKVVVKAQRYWRLSFQPLTRRYRLQVSNQAIDNTGLGAGLAQNFDALPEALSALQRIGTWTLGAGVLDPDVKYKLDFRFRLETSPLLRPWLVGAPEGEWGLSVQRNVPFKLGTAP
jgi:hypothetical protein